MSYAVIAALCAVITMLVPARAAVIDYKSRDGLNAIYLSGEIVDGDADRFKQIAASLARPVIVVLKSNGGLITESMVIGEAIRVNGYATAVPDGAECASACGLIWLAGAHRYVGKSGNIGFHAAYIGSGDDMRETGLGNALVGAYLTKLGLSYAAVAFATSAGPHEIKWLHPEQAQRLGIQADTLPDPPSVQPNANPTLPEPAPDDVSPLQRRMMSLVLSYYASWSGSGTDADRLAQYYRDTVTFYGTSKSRAKVLDEKMKFSVRWPLHHYTVKASTLFAQCTETCSVTGVVKWDVSSAERGAHSVGLANFVLKIAPDGSAMGGVILSESGTVLSAHNDSIPATPLVAAASPAQAAPDPTQSPEQQASSTTVAYTEGRQARTAYEAWFNALPDGPNFWAGNRSLKSPPACALVASAQVWQQGCDAARSRLATIDRRRKTDRDYWWGWNSL